MFTLSVSRGCVLVKAGNTLLLRGGLFPATYYQIFVSISIKFIFILGRTSTSTCSHYLER